MKNDRLGTLLCSTEEHEIMLESKYNQNIKAVPF